MAERETDAQWKLIRLVQADLERPFPAYHVASPAINIVSRLLSDEDIVVGLDVSERKRALEEVALLAGRRCHINHAAIFRALWRREQIASTALGLGMGPEYEQA